ncbi:MAG TPA: TonB-dependent receptor, partial [Ignavibacteria bacterium]
DQIVVTSEAPKFELEKADISTIVTQEQIKALPLDNRSIFSLAQVSPGIKNYAPVGGQTLPSSGAISQYNFLNLYINGIEWKNVFNGNIVGNGQTASPVPQDAIQEFKVILNAYDAEYTRGGAYIISAVTRRGNNDFHLNAFTSIQTKDLTTRGPFQKVKPDYNRQQGGITISGPIMKNKLFYTGTFEIQNINNYTDIIPGRPAYNPGIWDKYAGTFKAPRKNYLTSTGLTYYFDENNTFDFVLNYRYQDTEGAYMSPIIHDQWLKGKNKTANVLLKHNYTISKDAMNELSVHYLYWSYDEGTIKGGTSYVYPSLRMGLGTFPIQLKESHYGIIDKFTYLYGSHIFKTGVEVKNIIAKAWYPYYMNPEFTFTTDTSKMPRTVQIGMGFNNPYSADDARGETNGWSLGAFIQDNWKITERLSINYGIRWDGEINMLNNDNYNRWADSAIIKNNIPDKYLNRGDRKNSLANFSPRFSFNYDLFNNALTYLRGGFGLFYDRAYGQMGYFEYLYSNWGIYTINNPTTMDINELKKQILAGTGTTSPSLYLVDKEIKQPKVTQWSVGISHQFNDNLALSVDYIWKHYSDIYKAYNANYYKPSIKKRVISDRFGDIWLYSSFGKAEYYGFLSNIAYRYNQLFAQLSYTLSWAYSENDGATYTLKELYYMQRSGYDERHRFVFNWSYEFPYKINLSGIATLASPLPVSRYIGQDLNDDNNYSDDWLDGVRFFVPDWKKIRNWYKMFDLRLSKSFDFENFNINVMFEAYNFFNWFNASGYSGRMKDGSGNPMASFGQPSGAYLPRTMQLGIRVSY